MPRKYWTVRAVSCHSPSPNSAAPSVRRTRDLRPTDEAEGYSLSLSMCCGEAVEEVMSFPSKGDCAAPIGAYPIDKLCLPTGEGNMPVLGGHSLFHL